MYSIPVNNVAAGAEVFKVLIGSLISGARLKELVLGVGAILAAYITRN